MTTQIIDGSLREVREKLNNISDEDISAHVVLYKGTPSVQDKQADLHTDAYGKPFPTREETLAYLRERLQNPLTDPDEIRQADEEAEELARSLNQNRIDAGERPLFPE